MRTVDHPTSRTVRLRLEVPDRVDHLAGQHYVVRLTAPDGYRAQRSYSLASTPRDPLVELLVERLEDGEVSTHLADVVEPGDELEVRGPLGGFFVWAGQRRALLVAGGTGVVPFVSMVRAAAELGRPHRLRLVVSTRTRAELPYLAELEEAGAVVVTTREPSAGRPAGRLAAADLQPLWEPGQDVYVCGSDPFAEAASRLLVADLGVPAADIRIERFGASG